MAVGMFGVDPRGRVGAGSGWRVHGGPSIVADAGRGVDPCGPRRRRAASGDDPRDPFHRRAAGGGDPRDPFHRRWTRLLAGSGHTGEHAARKVDGGDRVAAGDPLEMTSDPDPASDEDPTVGFFGLAVADLP